MRTLIGDANEARRKRLVTTLAEAGCEVYETGVLASLADLVRRAQPDFLLLAVPAFDQPAPLLAIERVRRVKADLPVLLLVERVSEASAIAALRASVNDYFHEPPDCDAIIASARRCVRASGAHEHDRHETTRSPTADMPFVAVSAAMRGVRDQVARIAANDATVLITGETGTGKELIAALIHAQSRRRRARFVSINCPAIPDGLLESELFGHESGAFTGAGPTRPGLLQAADRGTVFFDEIGDMAPLAQAKILRAIETREVYQLGGKRPIPIDVRVIAATNQDLEQAVDAGRFRKDLYYRLNVARVHLPALRERRADIVPLLEHYLQAFNRREATRVEGFSPETIAALEAYDWPGNVRELKNLIEAIFVYPPPVAVGIANLPDDFRRRLDGVSSLPDADRRRIFEALLAAKWNKSKAAGMLHCSRMTLYRKLSKYSFTSSDGHGAKPVTPAGPRQSP